ncbi:DUF262 domain-containing protein [Bdellovibrio bacteriovorus]|uniref:DUF262 domain-containing protein n=1 Tax=Bdellovibrio bacteriovorus TaxID=959 RepID=UPI0035A638A2
MDLQAYPRTVSDLFSSDKKYVVPRFQREYSWGEEELIEFYNDIVGSISQNGKKLNINNYFIGSIVLIGQETSKEFQIVDGQQRLTTLTIIISVLIELMKPESIDDAQGLYKFVEGKDISNKPFFKLVNENPKPFLQVAIQNFDKGKSTANSPEERALDKAYKFFLNEFGKKNLTEKFNEYFGKSVPNSYLEKLQLIRDQVLGFKVISIYVPDQDYAYDIFETLNARGMDLTTLDLVKNEIFRALNAEHPVDATRIRWDSIRKNLIARDDKLRMDTFFRHFWISKFEFRTESKIFKSFKALVRAKEVDHEDFVEELLRESNAYLVISSPVSDDWTKGDGQRAYESLRALELFRVTQPRSLLLALMYKYNAEELSLKSLVSFLEVLENFHFTFTAICSSRASGLESKYSSFAREIRRAKKNEISAILLNLKAELKEKVPAVDIFSENFLELGFSNKNTRSKKLIQYIFAKHEKALYPNSELEMGHISIEHIEPQKYAKKNFDRIGNLLPLSGDLNSRAGSKALKDKIEIYRKSDLRLVAAFLKEVEKVGHWDEALIEQRGKAMAERSYSIWGL